MIAGQKNKVNRACFNQYDSHNQWTSYAQVLLCGLKFGSQFRQNPKGSGHNDTNYMDILT
jgi:hypothetical protein